MTNKEAINRLKNIDIRNALQEDYDALGMAIKALEQQRWIPVSERLPEESLSSVLGWDRYRERCVFVQYIDNRFQITGKDETFDIVAWMPLPKPYKEGDNE